MKDKEKRILYLILFGLLLGTLVMTIYELTIQFTIENVLAIIGLINFKIIIIMRFIKNEKQTNKEISK